LPALASCGHRPEPPASLGVVEDRPVPAALLRAPLIDQQGRVFTLSRIDKPLVMLVPFLTLCAEVCPMTTGNLLQLERTLAAKRIAAEVQIVEVSVDPQRDTPERLRAYGTLTGADWILATESPDTLAGLERFFGFWAQRRAPDRPPPVDWFTHEPISYDVDHSDGYFLLTPSGRELFATDAAPAFSGVLPPALYNYLDAQGRADLRHMPGPVWTPSTALRTIEYALGRTGRG
jgi:cytochrome oxidase Cu insertion factor (SCO1/SenC/PrrC family)